MGFIKQKSKCNMQPLIRLANRVTKPGHYKVSSLIRLDNSGKYLIVTSLTLESSQHSSCQNKIDRDDGKNDNFSKNSSRSIKTD